MRAKELLSHLHLKRIDGSIPDDLIIENIAQDSRKVTEKSLFICIKGYHVDGHKLANEAVSKGAELIVASDEIEVDVPVIYVHQTEKAMAILSDAFYSQPSHQLKMIGVTGTNGKTTVTHLIEHVLQANGEKTGLMGTMYRKIGEQKIPTANTTVDSMTLQETLAEMVNANVTTCTMEVSSHALVLGRVWGVDYDIAVFTNLSQDHLDFHKTMENYALAKSLLFSQLGNAYPTDKTKYAVINIDDPIGLSYLPFIAVETITYGTTEKADIHARNIEITSHGTKFELVCFNEVYSVQLALIGKFNVLNVLAAFATGFVAGISTEKIIRALTEVKGIKGRFQVVPSEADFTVIVDYSHTPDSLYNALATIHEFANKEIYCVVGCGGDRDKSKRPKMAQVAEKYATKPVFTSDNPRTEDPEVILADMLAGVKGEHYQAIIDRREAIQYAINQAQTGDVILIAGKGHEDYQIIGETKHHFDDVEEAQKAIMNKLEG